MIENCFFNNPKPHLIMNFKLLAPILLLSVISFMSCGGDDPVDTGVTNAEFSGTIVYDFDPSSNLTCSCDEASGYAPGGPYIGTGTIAGIGRVNATNSPCFLVTEYLLDAVENPVAPLVFSIDNQYDSLTDSDGDSINQEAADYTLAFDASCNCLTGTVTATFNGGTGKYENASGSIDVTVSQDAITLVVTNVFNGLISY